MRDDLREQRVELDVRITVAHAAQGLVVHHHAETHVPMRGVHAQNCIARHNECYCEIRSRSKHPRPEPVPTPYTVHTKKLLRASASVGKFPGTWSCHSAWQHGTQNLAEINVALRDVLEKNG